MPPRAMALPDAEIVRALRCGDESVFGDLVDAHSPGLMRMAQMFVLDRAGAEEVVHDTWLGVLRGIDGFAERSSLKTWIFGILMNTAKRRAKREARSIPFSAAVDSHEPAVDADRFLPADHRYPGGWMMAPSEWRRPDEELIRGETRTAILDAIDQLPAAQRAVITMRDVEGFPPQDVCEALDISDGHQRVLLHRARSKVRGAIEEQLDAIELNKFAMEAS